MFIVDTIPETSDSHYSYPLEGAQFKTVHGVTSKTEALKYYFLEDSHIKTFLAAIYELLATVIRYLFTAGFPTERL